MLVVEVIIPDEIEQEVVNVLSKTIQNVKNLN